MKTFFQDRLYALGFFATGITMLVWNHWSIFHNHTMFIYALFFGPPALWFGLGSLIDPQLLYARYNFTGLSGRLFLFVAALSVLSIVFFFWLYSFYYGVR